MFFRLISERELRRLSWEDNDTNKKETAEMLPMISISAVFVLSEKTQKDVLFRVGKARQAASIISLPKGWKEKIQENFKNACS